MHLTTGNATAEDAQLRIDRENERLDRIDTLNEEIAIKKTSVLTSDAEGQELAQEMVESRVLNDRELDALREEKHRESLGMTQEEYQAMKDAELDKEFFDPADEDGNFYQSQFLDDLQGTTLTADELRTIQLQETMQLQKVNNNNQTSIWQTMLCNKSMLQIIER